MFALAPFIPAISGGLGAAGTAAAIGAGAHLLGGALDARAARDVNRSNAALSRDFATHGIRWRVADAKAAGLHPLYALGSTGPSYYPSQVVGNMGQAVSQAGQAIAQGMMAKAQLRVMHAQANYYDALAWAALTPSGVDQGFGTGSSTQPVAVGEGNEQSQAGRVNVKPDEVISPSKKSPWRTAGLHSFWQLADIGPFTVIHPRTDQPGDMDFLAWVAAAVGTVVWKFGLGYEYLLNKAPTQDEIMQVYRELRKKYPALLSQVEGQLKRERDKGPEIRTFKPVPGGRALPLSP